MFLMFVPFKGMAVNSHLWLHLRFLGMCVYFSCIHPILTILISVDFENLCKIDIISNNSEKKLDRMTRL